MVMLNERSLKNLEGVHPDLVRVVHAAYDRLEDPLLLDFIVTEGLRTKARQRQLVAVGASQTMNSRHLTGHAFDIAARVKGRVSWDWPLYEELAAVILDTADQLDIPVEWGGHWRSFKDGPHFQLPRGYERKLQDQDNLYDEGIAVELPSGPVDKHHCTERVFKRGDYGHCVVVIQRALQAMGYDIKVDGIYGPKTTWAVLRAQTANSLDRDGIVGPETWARLKTFTL